MIIYLTFLKISLKFWQYLILNMYHVSEFMYFMCECVYKGYMHWQIFIKNVSFEGLFI